LTERRSVAGRDARVVKAVESEERAVIFITEEGAVAVRIPHTTTTITRRNAELPVGSSAQLIIKYGRTIR